MQETEEAGFNPWVRMIPWQRKWQPTPVFLPEKFHGQRSLQATVHGATKSQTQLSDSAHTHTHARIPCFTRSPGLVPRRGIHAPLSAPCQALPRMLLCLYPLQPQNSLVGAGTVRVPILQMSCSGLGEVQEGAQEHLLVSVSCKTASEAAV